MVCGDIFYWFNQMQQKPSTSNVVSAKRKNAPVNLHSSTPSKRSRSAPDNDEHAFNENRPATRGRQQVRFNLDNLQKENHPPRSKSDHRPIIKSTTVKINFSQLVF
jgi:hypothetical protein